MASQKVAVVTGGNKGIGYAIVKGLCERFKGIVYLTARDVTRGEEALKKLADLGFNPLFHQLDIKDQSSVEKFRNHIQAKHGGIDVLVNNAAIAFLPNAPEPLGVQAEETIAVNYYATLRVCEVLFPILRQDARVINVSSAVGHLSYIPSADLRARFNSPTLTIKELNKLMNEFVEAVKNNKQEEAGWGNRTYPVSKVGLTALTFIQQRLFEQEQPNRNISINSVHPGYVDTDLNQHTGVLTIEEGAFAPLYLALDAENLKGEFVWCNGSIAEWDSETITKPKPI